MALRTWRMQDEFYSHNMKLQHLLFTPSADEARLRREPCAAATCGRRRQHLQRHPALRNHQGRARTEAWGPGGSLDAEVSEGDGAALAPPGVIVEACGIKSAVKRGGHARSMGPCRERGWASNLHGAVLATDWHHVPDFQGSMQARLSAAQHG